MADKTIPYKIYLSEEDMPKAWYNLRADMKNKPAPLLNPGTGKRQLVPPKLVLNFKPVASLKAQIKKGGNDE